MAKGEIVEGLVETTAKMRAAIASIPGLRVVGEPIGPVLAITSSMEPRM